MPNCKVIPQKHTFRFAGLLMLAALLMCVGCGYAAAPDSTPAGSSNPANTGSASSSSGTGNPVTGSTQLQTSPASVNFGSVLVGNTTSSSVILANSGSASVTITQATLSGPGFSLNGLSLPLTLAPGQGKSFQVTFSPGNSGVANGSVSFANTSASSPVVISLAGSSVPATTRSADLTWAPSTSTVTGYHVYRSTGLGGTFTRLTGTPVAQTFFSDTSLSGSGTMVYTVTAVDASSQESTFSNQASANIP
jgi:hypothetical protein